MKILVALILMLTVAAGCKPMTRDEVINAAALHFSGVFITKNIPSPGRLSIKGGTVIKKAEDNTFYVSGSVEGFSPMNYPVSMGHFSETVRYVGGDTNAVGSWVCMEIYVGNKKMK